MTSLQHRMQSIRNESAERVRIDFGLDVPTEDHLSDLKEDLHRHVIESLGPRLFRRNEQVHDLETAVGDALEIGMKDFERPLSTHERTVIRQELTDEILAYGPITRFLRDATVSEIMVNSFDNIYVERRGKIIHTNARFVSESHLERIIQKIVAEVGRRIDEACPMVDARLPDGSRVNAIIPPLAISGSCLTIRKFRAQPLTIDDLIKYGTLTPKAAQFLQLAVRGEANVLVSGGTGSGKTTTLNVLSAAIPEDQRIITVEDAAELQLEQQHVISLESRPANTEGKGSVTIRDLVKNCLRMRPDRIVVGECRGGEAVDMLQAMNTGHDGSMTTVHANGPRDSLMRLEMLVLMAGVDLPMRAIREQIAAAVDLIVHVERMIDGSRRITHITEVGALEQDVVTLQDIFCARYESSSDGSGDRLLGPLRMTGIKPQFIDKMASNGVQVPAALFSLESDQLSNRRSGRWMMDDAKGKGGSGKGDRRPRR